MRDKIRVYRGDCSWRKRQIKNVACRGSSRLRYAAAAILALETAILIPRGGQSRGLRFQVIRQESVCQVEWILPQEDSMGKTMKVYGIRFFPETWDLQIYRREELQP